MTKLKQLEIVKDKAALRHCEIRIRMEEAEFLLRNMQGEEAIAYREFLLSMRNYFEEKSKTQ